MRIARTFTIDIDLAQELRRKVNQSETVNRALRKYLAENEGFDLRDVTIFELLGALQSRFDQFDAEYSLIQTLIAMCKPS
jgi:metal-responsive CopG/Arc/MetJ family transcriptional regulator